MSEQLPDAGAPTSDPNAGAPAQPRTHPGTEPDPAASPPGSAHQVHRSPRYGAFLVTGGLLGVLVAVLSGALGTGDGSIGTGQLIGYLAIVFGLLGALLGGAVAVLIERFGRQPGR